MQGWLYASRHVFKQICRQVHSTNTVVVCYLYLEAMGDIPCRWHITHHKCIHTPTEINGAFKIRMAYTPDTNLWQHVPHEFLKIDITLPAAAKYMCDLLSKGDVWEHLANDYQWVILQNGLLEIIVYWFLYLKMMLWIPAGGEVSAKNCEDRRLHWFEQDQKCRNWIKNGRNWKQRRSKTHIPDSGTKIRHLQWKSSQAWLHKKTQ